MNCANFALKSTANDFEEEFGASAADFVRKDFYVDDGLKSVPLVDDAVKLIVSVKQMCSKGGFRLHKFVSNSKEVIRRIPEQDRADGVKELDLDLDSLPLERALGVHWCVESDCFQFAIVLQDKPCTRRGILVHTIKDGERSCCFTDESLIFQQCHRNAPASTYHGSSPDRGEVIIGGEKDRREQPWNL